jgi:hypothetical protein
MTKSNTLTRRQLAVIEDLFASEMEEQEVLDKHNVKPHRYEQWLADERFLECFERRIARAYRESRAILARCAPLAAVRLVQLTECEKEEIARKACLDIISLHTSGATKAPQGTAAPKQEEATVASGLSPQALSRLLAALANESHQQRPAD